MDKHQAYSLRHAAKAAMRYYPNAHLGDCTRREDLRSAFLLVRRRVERGFSIDHAIQELDEDVSRYMDM